MNQASSSDRSTIKFTRIPIGGSAVPLTVETVLDGLGVVAGAATLPLATVVGPALVGGVETLLLGATAGLVIVGAATLPGIPGVGPAVVWGEMLPVIAPVGLAILGGETPPTASGVGLGVAEVAILPGDTGLAVGPGAVGKGLEDFTHLLRRARQSGLA